MRIALPVFIAALAVWLISCFNPDPPLGKACAPGDLCPPGQACVSGICQLPGTEADARVDCPWRSAFLSPCGFPLSSAELLIDNTDTFDSDDLEFTNLTPADGVSIQTIDLGGVDTALIVADQIRFTPSASLRLRGSRPVVFAGHTSVRIEGTLDLSSSNVRGAGGSPANCPSDQAAESRGGAGGSQTLVYGGDGGGDGSGRAAQAAVKPTGPTPLQGGCRGRQGGDGENSGDGGSGGHGGGAVYLSAGATIEISGRLLAGGSGGDGGGSGSASGSAHPGGGGGGAGGHIIVESPSVMFNMALITANGGGGGGGTDTGSSGSRGQNAGELLGGDGGQGAGASGDGGKGGEGAACAGVDGDPGVGTDPTRAGGGGGGACGRLDVYADSLEQSSSTLSPGVNNQDLPE